MYEEHTSPTLRLQLSRTELIVECNEIGFSEKDVLAICKVNTSTKKSRNEVAEGCIGVKGIGMRLQSSATNSG